MAVIEEEGKLKISPGEPDVNDVLEYAELLIETEGWNPFKGDNPQQSSPEVGWTLHDAIGEANRRLFPGPTTGRSGGKEGAYLATTTGRSGGKEGAYLATEGVTTRTAAMDKLKAALPQRAWLRGEREPDKVFNDRVTEVEEVLKVLRKARGAA